MTRHWSAADFDTLYGREDPFGYRDRWYEARKRALLLAMLPKPHYDRAWELGCSNGELTAALAPRCRSLLATDISSRAVELARERTRGLAAVQVRQADHPTDWPDGTFDLIVLSEMGYYLDPAEVDAMGAALRASLHEAGTLVACHWLPAFDGAQLAGAEFHRHLAAAVGLPCLGRYRDSDVLVEMWSSQLSVATLEGLR